VCVEGYASRMKEEDFYEFENESIIYLVNASITNHQLNRLFAASWGEHQWCDFEAVLSRSLGYVCAYLGDELIGFVNLAWDGGSHAFILDTTVHPKIRRRGIGRRLVRLAVEVAGQGRVEWVHVDFEPRLRGFYRECGFRHTEAGRLRLAKPREGR
jgi:ribosomal protein S18 acetylase RimI-like enzyme